MNAAPSNSDLANDSVAADIGITVLFPCLCGCGKTVMRQQRIKNARCKECRKLKEKENLADWRAKQPKWSEDDRHAHLVRIGKLSPVFRRSHNDPVIQAKRIAAVKSSQKVKTTLLQNAAKSVDKAKRTRSKNPLFQPGPHHAAAKRWRIRSPKRIVYEFSNLCQFIRENAGLFDPSEVIWKNQGCLAMYGLSRLRPDRKSQTCGSWHGWQWVSDIESRIGNNDLLGASFSGCQGNVKTVATCATGDTNGGNDE